MNSDKLNWLWKGIAMPIAILIATSNVSVKADSINYNISQNRENSEQRPEVIIDTYPTPFPEDRNRDTTNRDNPLPEDRNRDNNPLPEDRNRNTNNTDVGFECEYINGEYTVMYRPQSQSDRSFPWAVPSRMGGGWSPERRCNEIARRLEFYRPDGLDILRTGTENGYQILCATTRLDPSCRIVLTVPPGENAEIVRDRVFENLVSANNGQQTEGVYTFTDNTQTRDLFYKLGELLNRRSSSDSHLDRDGNIRLKPFLDRFDGGTGEKL